MEVNYKILSDCTEMKEPDILNEILKIRKIKDVSSFLRPSENDILPLTELLNIEKAFRTLKYYIDNNLKIKIMADNDVDGVTSSAIMYRYLKKICNDGQVDYFIGNGKEHGVEHIDPLEKCNGLLIIVDSIDEMNFYDDIIASGWKILCLDHHVVPQSVLDYDGDDFILVSSANKYKNPYLSGAGVCLKFCMYLDYQFLNSYSNHLYDLAACGIVADMSSMGSKENRYIVNKGLNQINNTGVKLLVGTREFNTTTIAFSIAPIVNACVRMNKNIYAAKIFAEDDPDIVESCIKIGKDCKEAQNDITNFIMENSMDQIQKQINDKVVFVKTDNKFQNISGKIANEILSIVQRPVIVYHEKEDNTVHGSMRAIGMENFLEVINSTGIAECKGHELSAGFYSTNENIKTLKSVLENKLEDITFSTDVVCDIKVKPKQITEKLINNIKLLNRMSGTDFPPINIYVETNNFNVRSMSNGKHLKIEDNDSDVIFIKWNDGSFEQWNGFSNFTGVGTPDINFFGRKKYKQIILQNYKFER